MELALNIKTDHILEACLSSLHVESIAWKNELDFLDDELNFFYSLLQKKEPGNPLWLTEIANAGKEFVIINTGKLSEIRESIERHEKQLGVILRSTTVQNEQAYRETHRKLLIEMAKIHHELKSYKQKLFRLLGENKS